MAEKEKPKYQSPRSNLSQFGHWLYDLVDYLQVDLPYVSERAGLNRGSLARSAKKGRSPDSATVKRVESALKDIAQEKKLYWPASELEQPLFNSASHATEGQIRKADQARRDIINEMIRRRDSLDKK